MTSTHLLTGKLAVGAVLASEQRAVFRLFLAESLPQKRAATFIEQAALRHIPVTQVDAEELCRLTGVVNHGGVAAEAGERTLSPFPAFLDHLRQIRRSPLLFALERFHDAHNFGYALRCLEALGVDGVLVSPHDWGREEGIISQSSSGAYDRLMLAGITDARSQFRQLESLGIESLSTTAGAVRDFYDFDLRAPVLIAVGGEFRGLSDEVKKACRHSAHLPMSDAIVSLPAGHAAAVMASEAARQRRLGGNPGPLWPRRSNRN